LTVHPLPGSRCTAAVVRGCRLRLWGAVISSKRIAASFQRPPQRQNNSRARSDRAAAIELSMRRSWKRHCCGQKPTWGRSLWFRFLPSPLSHPPVDQRSEGRTRFRCKGLKSSLPLPENLKPQPRTPNPHRPRPSAPAKCPLLLKADAKKQPRGRVLQQPRPYRTSCTAANGSFIRSTRRHR